MRSDRVDGVRLGIGTFTRYPVAPPESVDRGSARIALLTAPLWGLLVAAPAAALATLAWWLSGAAGNRSPLTATLAALIALATCAWFSRGLHLDGLADLADGLGSRQGAPRSLKIMREPGIGAFGAVSLVLVIAVQSVALGAAFTAGYGILALVSAVVLSRAAVTLLTTRGTSVRDDGLGAGVIGSTRWGPTALVLGVTGATLTGIAAVLSESWPVAVVALAAAIGGALTVRRLALSRLGVITGDVLGAAVEIAATAVLVVWALLG